MTLNKIKYKNYNINHKPVNIKDNKVFVEPKKRPVYLKDKFNLDYI